MSKTGPHVRPFEGATYQMLPPETSTAMTVEEPS